MAIVSADFDRPLGEPAPEVHGAVEPVDIRRGQHLRAQIVRANGNRESVQVWRMSPFGLEVIDTVGALAELGEHVTITLQNRGSAFLPHAATVVSLSTEREHAIVGLRYLSQESRTDGAACARQVNRWNCDATYAPTGASSNPMRYNDLFYFRVKDVSDKGMLLLTSLRNKHIVPGVILETMVMFPLSGQANVKLRMVEARTVEENGKDELALHAEIIDADKRFSDVLSRYLLQFGADDEGRPPTWSDLRQSRLLSRYSARHVEFSYVRTQAEYDEVKELRKLTFISTLADPTIPREWGDPFDSRARILIARFRGKIIGTLRLIFPDEDDNLENEGHVALPANLPSRDHLVEVGRLCIHPDYRGSDVLITLIRYGFTICAEARRPFILLNCEDKLVDLYRNVGANMLGASFTHKSSGKTHHLMMIDLLKVVRCEGLSLLRWSVAVAGVWEHLQVFAPAAPKLGTRLRMAIFARLYPVALALTSYAVRRRRR